MTAALLPIAALVRRDWLRFSRQKSRVAGFVASPFIFWIMIGAGFGNFPFFFPGMLTLTVVFAAVFSMMSLIEDRREGFLLGALVSPAPRSAIVAGKILGSALLAWLQGVLFLAAGAALIPRPDLERVLLVGAALFLVALVFTAFGFVFAWKTDSTQGFHAIVNLVVFPLWIVSGALFSPESAQRWMQWLMAANPLTYVLSLLRRLLEAAPPAGLPSLGASLAVTAVCGAALFLAALRAAHEERAG